ncbi:160aa long hypothetical protein [Pyrococcus horikoshii OT3]|uniref:Uncharacterized protein n=1 Tax=Pyrococcus horikoshii (strain ATCC 700860 / DSM 12428 / JCM 9974 / NBRC 100139 / OT-3) TaxID=70601 RepID=O59505_PYRHO|nr:160aa long hypothetical protein [Pyrococcus horikoshii OT3]
MNYSEGVSTDQIFNHLKAKGPPQREGIVHYGDRGPSYKSTSKCLIQLLYIYRDKCKKFLIHLTNHLSSFSTLINSTASLSFLTISLSSTMFLLTSSNEEACSSALALTSSALAVVSSALAAKFSRAFLAFSTCSWVFANSLLTACNLSSTSSRSSPTFIR